MRRFISILRNFHFLSGRTNEKLANKSSEDVQVIRKPDLENHCKDGGLWVVIHGKVYDLQDIQAQAPAGYEVLLQYTGKHAIKFDFKGC